MSEPERTLQCVLCRNNCLFVIAYANDGQQWALWHCKKCKKTQVEMGEGTTVELIVSNTSAERIMDLLLSKQYDDVVHHQHYSDTRRFFCPTCRQELELTSQRRIHVNKVSQEDGIILSVSISCTARCDNCFRGPIDFDITYLPGRSTIQIERRAK